MGILLGKGTNTDSRIVSLLFPVLTNVILYILHNSLKEIVFSLTIAHCFHQKHLEVQIAKVDREYEEYVSEDLLENIREIGDKYKKKAALIKPSEE